VHKKSEIYHLVWGTPLIYIRKKAGVSKLVLVGKITGLRKVIMNGFYMVKVYTYQQAIKGYYNYKNVEYIISNIN
jgi:hypothetical protein